MADKRSSPSGKLTMRRATVTLALVAAGPGVFNAVGAVAGVKTTDFIFADNVAPLGVTLPCVVSLPSGAGFVQCYFVNDTGAPVNTSVDVDLTIIDAE